MTKVSLLSEWTLVRTIAATIMIVSLAFYCCSGLLAKILRSTGHHEFANGLEVMALWGLGAAAVSGIIRWSSGMQWASRSVAQAVLVRVAAVCLHLLVIFALWVLPYSLTYGGSRFYCPIYYELQFALGIAILVGGLAWMIKTREPSG